MPSEALIHLLLDFQGAIAIVFPIGNGLAMAMSIGHVTIIPDDTSSAVVPDFPPQQSYQPTKSKAHESQASHYGNNHIQQEVLVGVHIVYSWAQVAGAIVAEDIVDPIDCSGHWVAWLVFVNVGKKTRLLAVSGCEEMDYVVKQVDTKNSKYDYCNIHEMKKWILVISQMSNAISDHQMALKDNNTDA